MDYQFVIRFHDLSRQALLTRALHSVLADDRAGVVLVAHNVDPAQIKLPETDRIELVSLTGSAGLPGVAARAGYMAVTAPFSGLLDSDDYYAPGAIQTLRQRMQQHNLDAVLAPFHKEGKRNAQHLPTPNSVGLDAAKDKLFYRTAPFGVFRTELLQTAAEFGEKFVTGEDIPLTAYLYTQSRRIGYFWSDPAYHLGASATERASDIQGKSINSLLAPLTELWQLPHILALRDQHLHALVVKILRVNLWALVQAMQEDSDALQQIAAAYKIIASVDDTAIRALEPKQQAVYGMLAVGKFNQIAASFERVHGANLKQRFWQVLEPDSLLRWKIAEQKFQKANRKPKG